MAAINNMLNDLSVLFGQTPIGAVLLTFLISMTPILEMRAAIPLAAVMGLNPWLACVVSIIGNMVPVPFIIIFIRRIVGWMRTKSAFLQKMAAKLEAYAEKHGKQNTERLTLWGLILIVGIPLPGTGAWTGGLIAGMFGTRMKHALPVILFGVVVEALCWTLLAIFGSWAFLGFK